MKETHAATMTLKDAAQIYVRKHLCIIVAAGKIASVQREED